MEKTIVTTGKTIDLAIEAALTQLGQDALMALMQYMVRHNASHAKELADLAVQLEKAGSHAAYEQVMAAVSDFEKGNLRLSAVLASLK